VILDNSAARHFALWVSVAVVLDQLTAFVPQMLGIGVVAHPLRRQTGLFTDPMVHLGPHVSLVNVLHTVHLTGSAFSDYVARGLLFWVCFVFATREAKGWFELYVLRTVFYVIAAVGLSQVLSFLFRGGVVDWIAFFASSGRFICAVCLSDLYVPIALALFLPLAGLSMLLDFGPIRRGRESRKV
jgi:hypothetical protein